MNVRSLDGLVVHDALNDLRTGFCRYMVKLSLDGTLDGLPTLHRRSIVEEYANQKGLKGYCVLAADGNAVPQERTANPNKAFQWVYGNNGKLKPVQEWINGQDGKYAALFLYVCNPLNLEISSKSSVLFVPDGEYSVFNHGFLVNVRMFVPDIGYYNDIPKQVRNSN